MFTFYSTIRRAYIWTFFILQTMGQVDEADGLGKSVSFMNIS